VGSCVTRLGRMVILLPAHYAYRCSYRTFRCATLAGQLFPAHFGCARWLPDLVVAFAFVFFGSMVAAAAHYYGR
jgi:hypothetical protein